MRGLNLKSPKGRHFANGGPVRGPGTGTSDEVPDEVPNGTYIMPTDSTQAIGEQNLAAMGAPVARGLPMRNGEKVPVQLSNGEFKLPPEQVHAVGVQALDQMKDATHTPTARGFAPANVQAMAKPEEPRQFFASGGVARGLPLRLAEGGLVDDERFGSSGRLANVPAGIGGNPAAPVKAQPAAASAPAATSSAPAAAPSATQPDPMAGMAATGFNPNISRQAERVRANASAQPSAAPVAAAVMPTQVEGWRTKAVMDGAAEDAQRAWDSGSALGAAGAVARGAITAVPTAIGEFAANTAAPIARGLSSFYDGLTGNAASPAAPAPKVAPPAPAPAPKEPPSPVGQEIKVAALAAPPAANPPTAPDTTAAEPTLNQVMPGVYRNGNSYSDTADGAAAMAQPRGLPSAQNLAAADALAARSASPAVDQAPTSRGLPGFVAAPTVRHSGNDWAARNALRNAEVSASSITNRGLGRGRTTPELQAYQQALATDAALQQADPAMEQAAMRENAGLQRETMRQDGETQRTGMRTAVDQQRVGIDGRRVATDERRAASEISARGLDIRAGQRQQDLQDRYAAAKTPEERAAIAQQVRDLSGRPHESPYKLHVTPTTKNADSSTTMGSVYRINTQTGDVQEVGASKVQDIATDQRAIAIRDNKSMTREQKAAALQQLGYSNA